MRPLMMTTSRTLDEGTVYGHTALENEEEIKF